jgi:hypothetical protein
MKALPASLMVVALAAAAPSPLQAFPFHLRYAVQATCTRSGIVGIGTDVTVAGAAKTAVKLCRAAGGSASCCGRSVTLWRLL